MFSTPRSAGRIRLAVLAVVGVLTASGCVWQRSDLVGPAGDSSHVVQRPTYEVPGTKPLSLGGYAGANYGPASLMGR